MQSVSIIKESKIIKSSRVAQLSGLFDLEIKNNSTEKWKVDLPLQKKKWEIGLIVGASGSGKTTVLNEFFGDNIVNDFNWDKHKSIIDGFPENMGIKEIVNILSSVGFSSPPYWLKPFSVLSTGQKFRVHMARAIAENSDIIAIDEFTSVIDRTVAKIGSSAIAKTIRSKKKKLVVATCHNDVEEWLQPDWIYKPHENEFQWRLLRQRPEIKLDIFKVDRKAWNLFKQHHYLSKSIHNAAQCFIAFWNNIPVSFYAYLHFPNNKLKKTKRGHRGVCLPDYQGVGIGVAFQDYIASCLKSIGFDFIVRTAHPAMMKSCNKSKKWGMIRKPSLSYNHGGKGRRAMPENGMIGRMAATFRYFGEAENKEIAFKLINQKELYA